MFPLGLVLRADTIVVGKGGNLVSIFMEQCQMMDAGAWLTFSFLFSARMVVLPTFSMSFPTTTNSAENFPPSHAQRLVFTVTLNPIKA